MSSTSPSSCFSSSRLQSCRRSKASPPKFANLEQRLASILQMHPRLTVLVRVRATGELLGVSHDDCRDDAFVAMRYALHFRPGFSGKMTINERRVRISWLSSANAIVVFAYTRADVEEMRSFEKSAGRFMRSCARMAANRGPCS